jgi:hypothetical protein
MTRLLTATLLAATTLAAGTAATLAAPAVGLVGEKTLVWFDTDTLEVTGMVDVEGVDTLWGIDVRPADRMLYGVAGDGTVVTIDPESGEAARVSQLSETLPDGVAASVDFNPMADRLRIMGSDGTNLRADVDTGETTVDGNHNWEADDDNADATPMIVATAYINSFGTPEATAQYNIDAGLGALVQQTTPNEGVLATRGELGVPGRTYAFDIWADAELNNTAWLIADNILYTVDLETGAATEVGALEGVDGLIRDLALLQ